MAPKVNCWEFNNCGREPGGINTEKQGVCPATCDSESDGLNGGKNGGRICWAIAGTFSGEKPQCRSSRQHLSCITCDFYKTVTNEKKTQDFTLLKPGQKYQSAYSK